MHFICTEATRLKLYPRSIANDCNSFRNMLMDIGNLKLEIQQDNLNNHQLPQNEK